MGARTPRWRSAFALLLCATPIACSSPRGRELPADHPANPEAPEAPAQPVANVLETGADAGLAPRAPQDGGMHGHHHHGEAHP